MKDLLKKIHSVINEKNYALRPHVVRHMLSEGFNEDNIIEVITTGKILELYENEYRCLISGTYMIAKNSNEYLHVVIDYWAETDDIDWIDIVTAYIPRRPFWETPFKRGKR